MAQQSLFGERTPRKTKTKKAKKTKSTGGKVKVSAYERRQGRMPKRHPAGTKNGGRFKKGG